MTQGLLNANTSVTAAESQTRGLNTLKAEARRLKAQVESGNGDVEGRQSELEDISARIERAEEMIMDSLEQANEHVEEAAEADREAAAAKTSDGMENSEDKASSDKTDNAGGGQRISRQAAAEAKQLSDKHSSHNIVAVDYAQGMTYGRNDKTNVAISPKFLEKLAADPELKTRYDDSLVLMREFDLEHMSMEGIVSQGWAVDKDGGVSKWAVFTGTEEDREALLTRLSEFGKEAFGDSFRKVSLYSPEQAASFARTTDVAGMIVDEEI